MAASHKLKAPIMPTSDRRRSLLRATGKLDKIEMFATVRRLANELSEVATDEPSDCVDGPDEEDVILNYILKALDGTMAVERKRKEKIVMQSSQLFGEVAPINSFVTNQKEAGWLVLEQLSPSKLRNRHAPRPKDPFVTIKDLVSLRADKRDLPSTTFVPLKLPPPLGADVESGLTAMNRGNGTCDIPLYATPTTASHLSDGESLWVQWDDTNG